jgi:site-specific DNA-methyltransferase (cytosine-N4-specific)
LVDDGHAVFVIGRSKIHGELVDNSRILQNAAKYVGLSYLGKIRRTIKSSRKSFNLSHANIKNEELVIFRK